jgi:hypothetical protein
MYEAICTKLGAALWRLFRGNFCVAFDIGGMVGVSGMYGIGFFGCDDGLGIRGTGNGRCGEIVFFSFLSRMIDE